MANLEIIYNIVNRSLYIRQSQSYTYLINQSLVFIELTDLRRASSVLNVLVFSKSNKSWKPQRNTFTKLLMSSLVNRTQRQVSSQDFKSKLGSNHTSGTAFELLVSYTKYFLGVLISVGCNFYTSLPSLHH